MKLDMTSSPGSPYDVTISKGHVNDVTNFFVKSPELTRIQCSDNEGMISIYYDETDTILQTTAALETSFHSFSNTITMNTTTLDPTILNSTALFSSTAATSLLKPNFSTTTICEQSYDLTAPLRSSSYKSYNSTLLEPTLPSANSTFKDLTVDLFSTDPSCVEPTLYQNYPHQQTMVSPYSHHFNIKINIYVMKWKEPVHRPPHDPILTPLLSGVTTYLRA